MPGPAGAPTCLLYLAGLMLCLGLAVAEPARADDLDYLVEVRVNGFALPDYLPLVVRGDDTLMIAAEWIWLAGEAEAVREQRRLRLAVANTGESLEVDLDAEQVVIDGIARPMAPREAQEFDQEILIADALLREAFEVDFEFNPVSQQLGVVSRRPWPRDVRLARLRTWARHGMVAPGEIDARTLENPYRAWGTPQADISASFRRDAEGSNRANYSIFGVAEAALMTHYLSAAGDNEEALSSLRWSAGRQAPAGGMLGLSELREFRIGDISGSRQTLIGGGQPGRGILLHAAPLTAATDFDETVVEGPAAPGWDAELYVGTRLLDFQRIGEEGRYRFENVPLDYGLNRLRVVLYGPQGQVYEDVQAKRIGGALVPPGRLYSRAWINEPNRSVFGIDTSARETSNTNWVGGFRADYGLSRSLTVGAHMTRALDSNGSVNDYLGVDIRPVLGRFDVALGGARQLGGGESGYLRLAAPLGPASASFSYFHYGNEFGSEENEFGALARSVTARLGTPLRLGRALSASLSVANESRWDRSNQVSHTRSITVGHRLGPAFLSHELSQRGSSDSVWFSGRDGRYRLLASFQAEAWELRGELQRALASNQFFDAVSVSARWRRRVDESLSLGVTHSPGSQPSWNLGWSREWDRLTFSLNAAHSPSGSSLGAGVSFSLGQAPGGRMTMSSRARADRGMVEVFVYEDLNANGLFNPDHDRPVSGSNIMLNGRPHSVATSADGRVRLDALSPLSPVVLGVSRSNLPGEFLVPMSRPVRVWPRPGQTLLINIPVTDSAAISGYVYRRLALDQTRPGRNDRIEDDEVLRPIPRVRVQVLNAGGQVHAETLTLSDGYFSIDTVFPGAWTVRIVPGQTAGRLQLEAPTRDVVIEPGQIMVSGIDLEVTAHEQ